MSSTARWGQREPRKRIYKKRSRLYWIWSGMIQRCRNENSKIYKYYWWRGITVCEEWKTSKWFFNSMPEGYAEHLELDRIDNNGNYEPGNCRWATEQENARNRRSNIIIDWMCLKDLSKEKWIHYKCVWSRYKKWDRWDYLFRPSLNII